MVEAITKKGEAYGKAGGDLDHGVSPDEPGAAYLMDAHMKGYNRGRKAKS